MQMTWGVDFLASHGRGLALRVLLALDAAVDRSGLGRRSLVSTFLLSSASLAPGPVGSARQRAGIGC